MSGASSRGRGIAFAGVALLALAAVLWVLARDEGERAEPAALSTEPVAVESVRELPDPLGGPRAEADVSALRAPEGSALEVPAEAGDAPEPVAPLDITLRHADGEPAGGALVAVTDADGELLAELVAPEDGRLHFDGWDAAVRVHAAGLSPRPAVLELELGRGAHELALPEGAVLAGRVLVDGEPPGQRFPLAIDDDALAPQLFEGYPGDSRLARLPGQVWGDASDGFLTDADGHFRISGLPHGWVVKLEAPRYFRRDATRSSPEDTAVPALDYTLALLAPALITGRVLTAEGAPAFDATLKGWVRFPEMPPREGVFQSMARGHSFHVTQLDADARFALPLEHVRTLAEALAGARRGPEPGATLDLELDARSDVHGTLHLEREGLDASLPYELGDLYLAPSFTVRVRVLDLDGAPLADASVRPEVSDPFGGRVLRTDADGLVEFLSADSELGLATVVAAGRQAARVTLPAAPQDAPVEVRLGPTTSVDFELLLPAHWSNPAQLNMQVIGERPLFEEGALTPLPIYTSSADPDGMRWRFQNSFSSGYGEIDGQRVYEVSVPREALHLEGLRPHTALRFVLGAARDPAYMGAAYEEPFWVSDALWLEPGEQRRVTIDLRDSERAEPERQH